MGMEDKSVAHAMTNGGGGDLPAATRVKCKNPYADRDASARSRSPPANGRKRMREDARFAAGHGGDRRGAAVEPRTALQRLRETRQWRDSWRSDRYAVSDVHASGLMPRLFVFRSRRQGPADIFTKSDGIHSVSSASEPTGQQQQQVRVQSEGTWELTTGITELSGEAGSGKTQICCGLVVDAARRRILLPPPGDGGDEDEEDELYYTAIYAAMGEGTSTSAIAQRIHQMATARGPRSGDRPAGAGGPPQDDEARNVMSRIGLVKILNEDDLATFVNETLPGMLENSKVGVVVLDSIANFFRFSDPTYQRVSGTSMFHVRRSGHLLGMSSRLRRLSDVYHVPIVVTNQVTASIPPLMEGVAGEGPNSSALPAAEPVKPALGLVWSNCVSTRILLERRDGMLARPSSEAATDLTSVRFAPKGEKTVRVRKARILQSVNLPPKREVWYTIDTAGVDAIA